MNAQLTLPVPEPAKLSPEERAVWTVVSHHEGRSSAISVPTLASLTGLSEQKVRASVSSLVTKHGKRIGSASDQPAGYFIVQTPEEAEAAFAHLRSRAMKLLVRAAKLQRRTVDEVYSQGKLELRKASV